MGYFKINADDFHWMGDPIDDPDDLCLHGHAIACIGDRKLEYDCTVSATALYLLKTLTEDHIINEDNQMLPCCGFMLIPDDELTMVSIVGCANGIDWSVIHDGDNVKIVLEDGAEEVVAIEDYTKEVYQFADRVEAYYDACPAKKMCKLDRDGYIAFWNEWRRRRGRKE